MKKDGRTTSALVILGEKHVVATSSGNEELTSTKSALLSCAIMFEGGVTAFLLSSTV